MRNKKVNAMALALCMTLAFGSTITARAEYVNDGCVRSEGGGGYSGPSYISLSRPSSSSSGSSSSSSGKSSGSSSSSGGSSSNVNSGYVAETGGGAVLEEVGDNGGNGVASVPTGLETKGSTTSVPGYETFRQVLSTAGGTCTIYHMGTEQYTAQLVNADGNQVGCSSITLFQSEDGKWYMNFTTTDSNDSSQYNVTTIKGSVSYLSNLGISGVMVDGRIAAESVPTE